jgi:hypothetical protein
MQTFDTPGPIAVELELGVGEVQITASDRADTVVDVRATNPARAGDVAAAERTTVDYANGRLRIASPKGWRHWMPWSGRESIDVHIDLPAGSGLRGSAGVATLRSTGRLGDCRYKAGVGNVHIAESGPVAISVGSGDIDVGHTIGHVDIRGTGAVHLGTVDGAAVVKNSNGDTSIRDVVGDLRVSSANGNVVVGRARATVVAKSANGDLRIDRVERGRVVAQTARGKVEVGVLAGAAAWLDLVTGFGEVRNELEDAGPPASSDDALEVRARTGFGDITIRRALRDPQDA